MELRLDDFQQLRLIAWNLRGENTIEEKDAFGIYERNWRWVDQTHLDEREKALITRLTNEYGHGVMNV